MNNPCIKLIVRLSVILAALLLLCRVHEDDEFVIAGEAASVLVSSESMRGRWQKSPDKDHSVLIAVESDNGPGSGNQVASALSSTASGSVGAQVAEADNKNKGTVQSDRNDVSADVVDVAGEDYPGTPFGAVDSEDNAENVSMTGEADQTAESAGENAADVGDIDAGKSTETDSAQQTVDTSTNEAKTDEHVSSGLTELERAEYRASQDENYKTSPEYINALLVTDPKHYNAAVVNEALSIPTENNDARYNFITGLGYKAYTVSDMPAGFKSDELASAQMSTFDVPVWRMNSDGKRYASYWSITINSKLEASVRCIFSEIFRLDMQFPFNYLKGYMYRKVGGVGLVNSKLMSAHSFGVAIDINYWDNDNDYFLGKGNDLRDRSNPFCIPDEVIEIFERYGWFWGGNFDICADTMHFQYYGLDFLQYDSDEPFPILYFGAENMAAVYVKNLSDRLVKLGYLKYSSLEFNEDIDAAVRAFQASHGLTPDGIVNYRTWEPMINETHDMSYVF